MKSWGVVQVAAFVLLSLGPTRTIHASGTTARHAGYIQSVQPSDRTLLIEEVGGDGAASALRVRIRDAEVVRVWRDPADPGLWREHPTTIYRWPVGTFVVVIGRATSLGVVEARRIEIPKITSE